MEVHIPFVHGLNEAADSKLLPNGYLTDARNIRIRKDGRLGSRNGYAFLSGSSVSAAAAGNFGKKRSVYFQERASASSPAKWYDRRDDGIFSTPQVGSCVGTLGVPRRVAIARNTTYSVLACDMVSVGSYHFVVYNDADYNTGTIYGTTLLVCEQKSNRVLLRSGIGGTSSRNPKIVAVGNTVMAFFADAADAIKVFIIDATTLSSSISTVVTAAAGRAFSFDVAPLDATSCLLVYETSAVQMRWGTVTAGATFTIGQNQVIANVSHPSIGLGALGNVVVGWTEGAAWTGMDMNYLVSTTAGAAVIAKTTLAAAVAVGFPVVGPNATSDYSLAWNVDGGCQVFTKGKAAVANIGALAVASKPFTGPNSACLFWCVNFATSGQLTSGSYKLMDVESPHQSGVSAVTCEAVACQRSALSGGYQTTNVTPSRLVDPRRFCVSTPTVLSAPSSTAVVCALPVTTAKGFGADLVRIDSSPWGDRLLPASLNGQLFFSGPRVREFDGASLYETGFADGPEYVALADAGAGSMVTAGDYQYSLVYEWFDAGGRRHRSAPSLPVTISQAANRNVTVSYSKPAFTDRLGGFGPAVGVYVNVYRTQADGTVFYLVNQTSTVVISGLTGTGTYTDSATDVAIATHEVLYTQGARGGLSGLLPNDEPPPCRFMWAGNSRLIMGGLERSTEVQWSKLIFPGEPVQFSIDAAFKANVDAEVTAVASLDGAWYIFTADSIWGVAGDGPDDSGVGSFSEPRRVASEVGCVSHRSIVETPQGLMFYARDGRMYLLPRGGGSPQWIGQPARDLFEDIFIVGARMLAAENVVAWLCINNAATYCFVVLYDTRVGEWTYDFTTGEVFASARKTLDIYDDKLVFDGKISQTADFTDNVDGSTPRSFSMVVTTGDVRPFGPMGRGRCRKVSFLGEQRTTDLMLLQLQVSYDSGNSYGDVSEAFDYASFAGSVEKREHRLKTVRGESFRFKVVAQPESATVGCEGLVFNNLTVEVFTSGGTPDLSASERG